MNVKAVLTVMILLSMSCVGAVAVMTDGSDAASSTADYSLTSTSGKDYCATSKSCTYDLKFTENTSYESLSITYTATLTKDGKTVSSGVSPSSGSLTNGEAKTLTVSSQSTAGNYVLTVTIKETVKFADTEETTYTYTVSKNISIIKPITLSITLKNNGSTDLYKGKVVFYLDGSKIDGSETEVTVSAGSSTTVTYDYVPYGLSNGSHTYYILAEDGSQISGIGPDHKGTFYYNQASYDWLNYLGIALVVIMAILLAWVLMKPVVNRGKPKARKD